MKIAYVIEANVMTLWMDCITLIYIHRGKQRVYNPTFRFVSNLNKNSHPVASTSMD